MIWLIIAGMCLVLLGLVILAPVHLLWPVIGPALLVFVVAVITVFSLALLIPFQLPQSESQKFAADKIMKILDTITRQLLR